MSEKSCLTCKYEEFEEFKEPCKSCTSFANFEDAFPSDENIPETSVVTPKKVHNPHICLFEPIETWRNVTVHVYRCKRCGKIDISWKRQKDTKFARR